AEVVGGMDLIEQGRSGIGHAFLHAFGRPSRGRKGVIFTVPYITMGGKAQIRLNRDRAVVSAKPLIRRLVTGTQRDRIAFHFDPCRIQRPSLIMPPRPIWKGYLKRSLVSCAV